MVDEEGFKVIPLSKLVINSEGNVGVPLNILREQLGLTVIVKSSDVYIKVVSNNGTSTNVKGINSEVVATDNFKIDSEVLKRQLSFKEYYQKSLIYSSQNRGINRYDVIITATDEWYNITIKGVFESSCNITSGDNIVYRLIKFYFPISYEEILKGILSDKTFRGTFDSRDTVITSDDIDTKEVIFSVIGSKLK